MSNPRHHQSILANPFTRRKCKSDHEESADEFMAISRKVTSAANVAASEAYHETRWSDIVDLLEEGG